jgi:recombinational DNA repair ATPase RecF
MNGFRGASNPCEVHFDTKKPVVMLFGENGNGKSTIIDALDFAANGEFGSLEHRSTGGKKHPYIATVNQSPGDVAVTVTTANGNTRHALLKSQKPSRSGDHLPTVYVLRRAELLRLVEAKPGDRYKEFKKFIDVQNVETCEEQLRRSKDQTSTEYNEAVAVLNEADQALKDQWKADGPSDTNYLDWAQQQSETPQDELQSRVSSLKSTVSDLESVVRVRQQLAETSDAVSNYESDLKQVNQKIADLPNVDGEYAVQLVSLLEQARTVVEEPNQPDACPVCRQEVTPEGLRTTISEQLESLTAYRDLNNQRLQIQKQLASARSQFEQHSKAFIQAVRDTGARVKEDSYRPVSTDQIPWHEYEDFLQSEELDAKQLASARQLEPSISALLDAYTQKRDQATKDLSRLNSIKTQYKRLQDNEEKAKHLEGLADRLQKVHQCVEARRKRFTQDVLDSVASEVDRLYQLIHPGESIGALTLRMDPNRQNSVIQDAHFQGWDEVPPQGYYSDSHLDTLGFCVWLALAKRDDPANTVVVLDDVFTSVDGSHLGRIIPVLHDVAQSFAQVIVATHYRNWRDRYRLAQGPGLSVQLLELHRWSLNKGVCVSGTNLAVRDLRETLKTDPLDRQAVASQAGILLEALLDRLAVQYRVRLPRNRDNQWTLGDLLNACSKLSKQLTVEKVLSDSEETAEDEPRPGIQASMKPFLEEAGRLSFVRNQVGAHFNLDGTDVPDDDIRAFGEATVSLATALTCSNCGDVPSRSTGDYFLCGCKKTKMTPLEFKK